MSDKEKALTDLMRAIHHLEQAEQGSPGPENADLRFCLGTLAERAQGLAMDMARDVCEADLPPRPTAMLPSVLAERQDIIHEAAERLLMRISEEI